VGGTVLSSVVTTRVGRPWPWLFGGPLVAAVGSGLLFWELSFAPSTSIAKLAVFQVITAMGAGSAVQQSLIMVQAEYKKDEKMIPQVTSIVLATQLVGSVLAVAVSGTIFSNVLRSGLAKYAPLLSEDMVKQVVESVTAIPKVPPDEMSGVLEAYSRSLGYVLMLGIPLGILGSMSAFLMKNHNLKK